jgi:hypothetical protein
MKFNGKKKYTEVAISRHHKLFSGNDGTSSIANHLGFPLIVKKLQHNPEWVMRMKQVPKNSTFSPYENSEAYNLMIDIEVKSKGWGFADIKRRMWDKGLNPTVLVARKDMKDLTTNLVEALVRFSETVLWQEMGNIRMKEAVHLSDADDAYHSDYEAADEEAHIPTQKARRKFLEEYCCPTSLLSSLRSSGRRSLRREI